MKKAFTIIAALALTGVLASCNKNLIGTYTFNGIHVQFPGEVAQHFDINSWTDSNEGIEVELKNGTSIFCSEGTYMLYSGSDCPICG